MGEKRALAQKRSPPLRGKKEKLTQSKHKKKIADKEEVGKRRPSQERSDVPNQQK